MQLVDSAPLAPGGCMVCRGTGPKNAKILDMMQEFSAQQLRLYLCKIHAREVAVTFGYAKGPRMDELDKAAEQIIEIEKERDEANEAAHKMAEEVTRLQQQLAGVESDRQKVRDERDSLLFRASQVNAMTNEMLVVHGNGG